MNPGSPDERERRLERAAATGDRDAEVALIRARLRSGQADKSMVWFKAILGDDAAAETVGWDGGPAAENPIASVVWFLSREKEGIPDRGPAMRTFPWPRITAREQHRLSTLLAILCAEAVAHEGVLALRDLVTYLEVTHADVSYAGYWDQAEELLERNIDEATACVRRNDPQRSLRTIRRRIENVRMAVPLDLLSLIEEEVVDIFGGVPHPNYEDSWCMALRRTSSTLHDPDDVQYEPAQLRVFLSGVMAYVTSLNALQACASNIGSNGPEDVYLPISGWLRDTDMPWIGGPLSDALDYAVYAYREAVNALNIRSQGRDLEDPEGQIELWKRLVPLARKVPLL